MAAPLQIPALDIKPRANLQYRCQIISRACVVSMSPAVLVCSDLVSLSFFHVDVCEKMWLNVM